MLFSCLSAIYLVGFLILFKLVMSMKGYSTKIRGMYATGGEWFFLKKFGMLIAIILKRWKQGAYKNGQIYNKRTVEEAEEWEKPQPVTDDPMAIDSLYFYGGDPESGVRFIVRLARRPERVAEFWFLVVLPDGRLLVHPNCPDTRMVNVSPDSWIVGGCRITCESPNLRWRINYNGLMKVHSSNSKEENDDKTEFVHINLKSTFRAVTNVFDVDTDLSSLLLAETLANEKWSKAFFKQLENEKKQKHLEQWGGYTGSLTIDRQESIPLCLQGYRDHSFGHRNWKKYYRYVAHFAQLENGASFSVGTVSMPDSLTHLRYGYYYTPYGRKCPITWHNINLWNLGEVGLPPKKYSFKFWAMRQMFNVELKVDKELEMYVGDDWGTLILERFCSFTVNGFKGIGVNEFCYRNIKGFVEGREISMHSLSEAELQPEERVLLTVPFGHSACTNSSLAGGKGAQLGQLSTIDAANVPKGFVVTTHAYVQFMKRTENIQKMIKRLKQKTTSCGNAIAAEVFKEDCETVHREILQTTLDEEIQQAILNFMNAIFGEDWKNKRFAVRSSASGEDGSDASSAGQMETLLGIKENIIEAVLQCWASQFTFQAVEYRRQHGLPINSNMAVVIQEMVPAEMAGVMFTNNPINGDVSQMMINSNFGLGESVVSGECEPDTITLTRTPDNKVTISEVTVGSKMKKIVMNESTGTETVDNEEEGSTESKISLPENLIICLAELGILIEKHYGSARDIEWAIANDEIYILQARPITTIDLETEDDLLHEFDSFPAYKRECLTTGNIGEMMPLAVTPLTLSIFGSTINRVLQAQSVNDHRMDDFLQPMQFLYSSCNHLFINFHRMGISSELHVVNGRMSMIHVALIGKILTEPNMNDIEYFVGRSPFLLRLYHQIKSSIKHRNSTGETKKWEKKIKDGYSIMPCYTAKEQMEEIDGRIGDYMKLWDDTVQNTANSAIGSFVILNVLGTITADNVHKFLHEVAILLSTCEDVYSADVPTALEKLAKSIANSEELDTFMKNSVEENVEWLHSLDSGEVGEVYRAFMRKHGHRCIREAEFREIAWKTEPAKVIDVIKNMIENSCFTKEKEILSVEESISRLTVPLNPIQKFVLKKLLPWARRNVGLREWGKSLSIVMCDIFKDAYRHLGELMTQEGRIPDSDLVYFFSHEELKSMLLKGNDKCRFPKLIAKALRRRKLLDKQMTLKYPEISFGQPKPINLDEEEFETTGEARVHGLTVSVGLVKGPARVIRFLGEASQIQKGDVLIVSYTDVGWTPYFPLLSGLVTEKGGLLSHGAVVAREYGIPCIVGCLNCTSIFKSGDTVILNANNGFIERSITENF